MDVLITDLLSARSKLPLMISYSLPSHKTRDCSRRHLARIRSIAFWFLSENRSVSLSHRNSRRSRLAQFLATASIRWSTWIFIDILSSVPITKIRAFLSFCNVEFHNWSVIWTIPDSASPKLKWYVPYYKKLFIYNSIYSQQCYNTNLVIVVHIYWWIWIGRLLLSCLSHQGQAQLTLLDLHFPSSARKCD